jgi:hypothetical protein
VDSHRGGAGAQMKQGHPTIDLRSHRGPNFYDLR